MSDIFLNEIQKVPENSKSLKMILKKNRINEKCMPFECEMIYIFRIKQPRVTKYPKINNLISSGKMHHIKRKNRQSRIKIQYLQ